MAGGAAIAVAGEADGAGASEAPLGERPAGAGAAGTLEVSCPDEDGAARGIVNVGVSHAAGAVGS